MQAYSLRLFYLSLFSLFCSTHICPCPQSGYPLLHHCPSMASFPPSSLKSLVVFRNRIHPELIRTVHEYRLEGWPKEVVEREYVFRVSVDYEEMKSVGKLFTLHKFDVSEQFPGLANGVWDCIYVFDGRGAGHPYLGLIPELLSVSSNPKLASIPSLARELAMISDLASKSECGEEPSETLTEESTNQEYHIADDASHVPRGTQPVPLLDLNSPPSPEAEDEENFSGLAGPVGRKHKRAATEDIAKLALEDLAKYFDVPIVEASKCLKVGVTVLKKKCREFGIPRWPHRKIKSLDGLIRDLQGEVERQQEDDEFAALAVSRRQKMIESEKESIEKKPFLEIQRETKKFRQDIFKRRHRERVHENQARTLPLVDNLK